MKSPIFCPFPGTSWCPHVVLWPSVTRLLTALDRLPLAFSFILVSSIGGNSELLSPWKNTLGTVVPTSIWAHPLRTSVSQVTCFFCHVEPSLFLQVVLTGGVLAADFGTADPTGPNSFMEPPTPDGVHWEHTRNSQSSEKAGGASEKKPLYKRRWFIISQVIACFVGIGLFFVLLFPIIKAIAQHIVNVSRLNVDRVMILEPTNTS